MANDLLPFFHLWFQRTVGGRMYLYQEGLVHRILEETGSLIINKARRTGISTTVAVCALTEALFGKKDVLVFSNSKDNAAFILERANWFLRELRGMQRAAGFQIPEMSTDKIQRIGFRGGGQVRSFAASSETVRGYDADKIYFDEFAHLHGETNLDRKMWQAILPMKGLSDAPVVVLSTPGPVGNLFWEHWFEAPEEKKITIHWTECPRLVKTVRIEEQAFGKVYWIGDERFDEAMFLQEFCNQFDPGYGPIIPLEALEASEDPESEPWEME
ncbi:MAG: terminase family protein [Candidatus Thermoplasmatota archaeon]|nr:terminase family protein [Candidatus Thermoplasmatota archaeon]